ncbi:hypothetical protein EVAR_39745_1 [Eumeta japonica]|uniref:Uncharacterized protein n=1 Tax=Eumeta variegata TaxID=151549 RepID=A0A4C1X6M4_EUMVA|nr:hypothetical protein EVAR_39745_1 [Eumeta japonica]
MMFVEKKRVKELREKQKKNTDAFLEKTLTFKDTVLKAAEARAVKPQKTVIDDETEALEEMEVEKEECQWRKKMKKRKKKFGDILFLFLFFLLDPDVMLQYAADNADINVSTFDGHNTEHIMGAIKIISPSNVMVADMPTVKCKSKPNAEDLAAVSDVPLLIYENNEVVGMSKITVVEIDYCVILNEAICSNVDLLWAYAKWRDVNGLPGWNGFSEKLTKNNKDFTTSNVMFLPFIHHPENNKDTIYTTLDCAVRSAKSHGQNCYIITFDQPLYYKAREIVAAVDVQSDISNVIVRLGGYHMLMSFLGSIGYIMEGSALKEALSVIYDPNSVGKMLDGHAFARSVGRHGLIRVALMKLNYDKLAIDQNLQEFLEGYIMDIMRRTMYYDNIEESEEVLNGLIQLFNDEVAKLKSRGPTAQLWLQYI